MTKENFILLSLDDSEAKNIANVVGNKSSKKILDYLAECDDSTESKISKKTGIPISTVHYNLQQLVKVGLVVIEEYHYSEKGKEVNHYKLANKYIIIAPRKVEGLASKLKGILPAFFSALGLGAMAMIVKNFFGMNAMKESSFSNMDMGISGADSIGRAKIVGQDGGANAAYKSMPMATEEAAVESASYGVDMAESAVMRSDEWVADTAVNGAANITDVAPTPDAIMFDEIPEAVCNIPQMPYVEQTIWSEYSFAIWFAIGALSVVVLYGIIQWIRHLRGKKIKRRKL